MLLALCDCCGTNDREGQVDEVCINVQSREDLLSADIHLCPNCRTIVFDAINDVMPKGFRIQNFFFDLNDEDEDAEPVDMDARAGTVQ